MSETSPLYPIPEAKPPVATPPAPQASPYIGLFTDSVLQHAVDEAGRNLEPGQTRIIFHADSSNQLWISAVKRFGEHISVEAAARWDPTKPKSFLVEGDVVLGPF